MSVVTGAFGISSWWLDQSVEVCPFWSAPGSEKKFVKKNVDKCVIWPRVWAVSETALSKPFFS